MVVNPSDSDTIAVTMYYFGGLMYTCGLCNEWMNNIRPDAVWDAGHSNPGYGHAIILPAKLPNGNYRLETWGLDPGVQVTHAGILSSDPELLVAVFPRMV
jgi:hypothetical protein